MAYWAGQTKAVTSYDWTDVLAIDNAVRFRDWAVRVYGAHLDVRVIAFGACGPEVVDDTVLGVTGRVHRFPMVPAVLAGTRLIVQARRSSTATTHQFLQVEVAAELQRSTGMP